MYAEFVKAKYGVLDDGTRRVLEVYIPTFSVSALIAITCWILCDAIRIIQSRGIDDDVNIYFLWGFSVANFLVDFISSLLFYFRHTPLRSIQLDSTCVDIGIRPLIPRLNLNMLSALTHVAGDTMRTVSVFVAAFISTVFHQPGSLCDAWASVAVSITIFICVIPLCREIVKEAFRNQETEELLSQITIE